MDVLQGEAEQALRGGGGIVVPVYLPASADARVLEPLVRDTVACCVRLLGRADRVVLAVDGNPAGAALAGGLADALGVQVVVEPVNRGKLAALRAGARILLEDAGVAWLATIDQDGDNVPADLPLLLRAGLSARRRGAGERVLVIGARGSLHHPMGWPRGELEGLADAVLLDALQYHAALAGRPLPLEFASLRSAVPDFHSGYKVFDRASAVSALLGEPAVAGCDDTAYYRHAVEAVLTVEALLAGARLVEAPRATANEQPVSAFGQFNRARLTADMILWPCRRLEAPGPFVDQWIRNRLPRMAMMTLVPEGRAELAAVHARVLEGYGLSAPADAPLAAPAFA